MKVVLMVALVCVWCLGCSNPNAPSNFIQIAGGWSGTFESNYSTEAIFVDLNQVSGSISGTWASTSGIRPSGTVSGSVDKTSFTGLLTYSYPNGPVCQGSFSGAASASTLTLSSPGFTGNCGLSAPGNPTSVRFVLQRR